MVTAGALALPAGGFAANGWSGPTPIDNSNPPQNVSCPTATFCAAVGAGGWGQTFNGSSWGAPTNIDPRIEWPHAHLGLVSVGLVLRRGRSGRQRADVQRQYLERAGGESTHADCSHDRVVHLGLVLVAGDIGGNGFT